VRRALAATAVVVGLLAACGGQSEQEKLADRLEEDFGLPSERADCVVNQVYERFSDEQIDELREAEDADDLSDDLRTDLYTALAPCASAGS
jgi:uncharacterized tellurite resistance protein B-like protein